MNGEQIKANAVKTVAELMCAAAITAPCGKGVDLIATKILLGNELREIADFMENDGKILKKQSFIRDANNIRSSIAMVIIGSRIHPLGLAPCGFCGYTDCKELVLQKGICTFNSIDLGIALGSAVKVASLHNIDNRVMYTAVWAMKKHNLLNNDFALAFSILLSISSKNIYFDRK